MAASPTVSGRPGQVVQVGVFWRNSGPVAAPSYRVWYTPPFGTSLAAGLPAGWQRSGRGAVRTVLGPLPAGAAGSASLPVSIPKTALGGSLLVGGFAAVRGLAGIEARPGNNEAVSRVRVLAVATPKPTPTPSPPKPSPKPSATVKPTPRPTVKPTSKPTSTAPAGPVTTRKATVTRPAASAPVRTYFAGPAGISGLPSPPQPEVVEITDATQGQSSVQLVPLIGALTCFTAAGIGGVMLRRRRAEQRSLASELRALRQPLPEVRPEVRPEIRQEAEPLAKR